MTAEKKRFVWILILIIFFFANLIVGSIFLFQAFFPASPAAHFSAATHSATQP